MLESKKILGEIREKGHGRVPYAERSCGLVLELKTEQQRDLESSNKKNSGERFF